MLAQEACMEDLTEGRVAAELQIGSWPPAVTQTLLHKSDGRCALTIRGKPSGRLRISVERVGFAPTVVRTAHLRLRTPTILKVQVAWRGSDAVVAAAGQVIGKSAEFAPDAVVSPAEVAQSAPPVEHVDNARMRELRRQQAAAFVTGSMSAGVLAERCLANLVPAALVMEDLAGLVRQGRNHHLPGLIAAIRRLVQGEDHEPAALQFCAGLLDAPLVLYVSHTVRAGGDPESLLAAAFDASAARDAGHELAIDLDAWLRQEARWANVSLPIGWLLRQAEMAIGPQRSMQGGAVLPEEVVCSPVVREALCGLAHCLCLLARGVIPEQRDDGDKAGIREMTGSR
jgi:hypothetical protein